MRLAFLVREGFLCEKLGLPKDIDPEFRDLSDYIEILELYLEALPSFIQAIRNINIQIIIRRTALTTIFLILINLAQPNPPRPIRPAIHSHLIPFNLHLWGKLLHNNQVQFIKLLLIRSMHSKTIEEEEGYRNKGVMSSSGKILKGTLNEAPIKLNVSSIPTKHENVIFKSKSQSAFGDSTRRFFNFSSNNSALTPGPGCYNLNQSFQKIDSKKGSGFFASQTKLQRLERTRSHIPGPGTYKVNSLKPKAVAGKRSYIKNTSSSQLNSSKSTAILSSRIQSRDLFKNQIENSLSKPSVGIYQLNPQKLGKSKSAYSTFKSKIDRFIERREENPPVGHYQISSAAKTQTLIKKSEPHKQQSEFVRQKNLKKAIRNLQQKQTKEKLGPGAYDPALSSATKFFKIKDTIYDRFGELKPIYKISAEISKEEVELDPNRQTTVKFTPSKTFSSVFKSATQRHEFKLNNQMDPGVYNANKSPARKSHLINFMQKWV